jgi:hypothetical protein
MEQSIITSFPTEEKHWLKLSNYSYRRCQQLYVVKKVRRWSCVLFWQLGSLFPTAVRGGVEILKDSYKMEDGPI